MSANPCLWTKNRLVLPELSRNLCHRPGSTLNLYDSPSCFRQGIANSWLYCYINSQREIETERDTVCMWACVCICECVCSCVCSLRSRESVSCDMIFFSQLLALGQGLTDVLGHSLQVSHHLVILHLEHECPNFDSVGGHGPMNKAWDFAWHSFQPKIVKTEGASLWGAQHMSYFSWGQ